MPFMAWATHVLQWGGQRAAEIEVLSLTETRMKIKVKDLVEGFGTYKLTLKKID